MIWHVQLLGNLTISRGSFKIDHFESGRTGAALAYLALNSNHPVPREELAEAIWPDQPQELTRHRLRQSIYSLRQQLEPPGIPQNSVLIADKTTLQLNPSSFSCDVLDFVKHCKSRQSAKAKALYSGEFMPGFFDEWILSKRYELMNLFDSLPDDFAGERQPELKTESENQQSGLPFRSFGSNQTIVSLPGYITEFFGREEEGLRLKTHIEKDRLVSLTGIGGVGKTRLAVEISRLCAEKFAITSFVPLEECNAPSQIPDFIARAIQLPPSPASPLERLTHSLSAYRSLMILDNFEQLADSDGVSLIEYLLQKFPFLTLLITSRRLLGISGEIEIVVSPLSAAEANETVELSALNPGIALFVNRAQSARPGFQINERNRLDIVELCTKLEGLPLALEIAASRIRAFSPSEMLAQLEDRFTFLSRPTRGASKDQRHRSLSATLHFSWRLLPIDQRRFLCALAVFKGGWTAELAKEVCDAPDAAERLESLVMDSLVISEQKDSRKTRFRLLESVREFLIAQMEQEAYLPAVRRHQTACLKLALGVAGKSLLPLIEECDNFSSAIRTAIEMQDSEMALSLCIAAGENLLSLAGPERSLSLLHSALAIPSENASLRINALGAASSISLLTKNRGSAIQMAEQAILLAGSDPALRANALTIFVKNRMVRGEEVLKDNIVLLEEALHLAEVSGDRTWLASNYRLLGVAHNRIRNFDLAEQYLNMALILLREAEDKQSNVFVLDSLASLAIGRDDLPTSLKLYDEARKLALEVDNEAYVAKVNQNFATVYARQERWAESISAGQECLLKTAPFGNVYIQAFAIWNLPEPLCQVGKHEVAARLMGFVERFWSENYDPLNEEESDYLNLIRQTIVDQLGADLAGEFWNVGAKMTLNEALHLSLNL